MGQHRLTHPRTIGGSNLTCLRKHLNRTNRSALFNIENLTRIHLRQVDGLTHLRVQLVQDIPRYGGQRTLTPCGMCKAHQTHSHGIDALIRVILQKPLICQRLQEPVQRRLGVWGVFQNLAKAHWSFKRSNQFKRRKRLTNCAVIVPCDVQRDLPTRLMKLLTSLATLVSIFNS